MRVTLTFVSGGSVTLPDVGSVRIVGSDSVEVKYQGYEDDPVVYRGVVKLDAVYSAA